MWTKVCGTTNLQDAELAVEFGADALGFIFAPSKRQVTPAQAQVIIHALPATVEKVGVFTTGDAVHIAAIVHETGLTAVQLHMPLQRELVQRLHARFGDGVRILQVIGFQVNPPDRKSELERFNSALNEAFAQPELFAVLIDAMRGSASGGLGLPIDWRAAAASVHDARSSMPTSLNGSASRLVLAGGLHANNLKQAVDALEPWGVDVVSGVEASPGLKDRAKLQAFLRAALALRG